MIKKVYLYLGFFSALSIVSENSCNVIPTNIEATSSEPSEMNIVESDHSKENLQKAIDIFDRYKKPADIFYSPFYKDFSWKKASSGIFFSTAMFVVGGVIDKKGCPNAALALLTVALCLPILIYTKETDQYKENRFKKAQEAKNNGMATEDLELTFGLTKDLAEIL